MAFPSYLMMLGRFPVVGERHASDVLMPSCGAPQLSST
jgi:hypothetical protein